MDKIRFFDFEVTPNWWLCVFGDLNYKDIHNYNDEIKNSFYVVRSDKPNSRDDLLKYLRDDTCVKMGYNIKGYDLIIANAIYQGLSPKQVKIINDLIINPSCEFDSNEHKRLSYFAKKKFNNIVYEDLMDDSSGSLKEKEAVLGLNVLESSVDFEKECLTEEDKEDMIYYCKQDVYASMQFYTQVVHPYSMTKLHLGKHFNIPEDICYKSTNARLVSLALGAKRQTYLDEEKINIKLPNKIIQYCYENFPHDIMQKILNSQESFDVNIFNNKVTFGNGGIHSVWTNESKKPPSLYVESDDEYCLVNVDATSYYPSIMIQFNLLSRSVENPQRFIDIFEERVKIKHKKDKTLEDEQAQKADKLILNTTFGASGNKYLDLYDPYMATSVCRVGQIFLGSLANKIYKTISSSKIIQTNTDGILVYLKRSDLPKLQELQDEWTKVSGINMERDEVIKIWQRDVNNYLMVELEKGEEILKNKGGWLNTSAYRIGVTRMGAVSAFACSKAIISFLLKNKNIKESLLENNKLEDFVMTCTKGPTYNKVVQINNGFEIPLFKANRVIASKDQKLGLIYKIKKYKDKLSYAKMPSIPEHCRLVNEDLSKYDFEKDIKDDLDYEFYINRCKDLLDIEWYQLNKNIFERVDKFDYKD